MAPGSVERLAIVGIALFLVGDLWAAISRRWYPVTLSRQTRKTLMYSGRDERVIGYAWGVDAGFSVGTYRVTSGIWTLAWLSIVGLVSPLVIFGYEAGFASALAAIVVWPVEGDSPRTRAERAVERTHGLIGRARRVQLAYVVALFVVAAAVASTA